MLLESGLMLEQTNFGKQLRVFRLQTTNPQTQKPLSQQKLGEYLGSELGDYGFSGAAVSDWELNKSKLDADSRLVLLSLIKVLNQYGGIRSISDANLLLESGNYRALNPQEMTSLFPNEPAETEDPSPSYSNLQFLLERLNFISPTEYRQMALEAEKGPPPYQPRLIVSLLNKATRQITPQQVFRTILWAWIWLLTYFFVAPSLNLESANTENLLYSLGLYTIGTLIIPPLIGGMTNTDAASFWKEQGVSNRLTLRLYVHQGAYVGFHVGYFFVFLFSFFQDVFDFHTTSLIMAINTIIPITVAYAGAQLVPYNLWRAYGRLHIRDGGIFFFFALLGPLWAWFFLEFYKILTSRYLGAVVLLLAMTLVVWIQTKSDRNTKPH